MKYNVIGYQIGEGFRNILKNKKSTASSLAIMCMVMLVFGAFFAISENINYIMNNIEDAQAIQAFMKEDATEEEIKEIGEKIKKINGVNTIRFVSKEEAYNTYSNSNNRIEGEGSEIDVLEGYDENYFPTSYIVTLTDLKLTKDVKAEIKKIDLITDIRSSDVTLETLMNLTKGIRIGTAVLLLILIFVSIFIISNTIKLTVYSRRKEISIMKYVGATNSFIRWPFIIEGIIIGIISGLISILVVGLAYNGILNQLIQTEVVKKIGIEFVNFSDMFNLLVIVYLVLGSGIGIIGSSMSMRKYLDV